MVSLRYLLCNLRMNASGGLPKAAVLLPPAVGRGNGTGVLGGLAGHLKSAAGSTSETTDQHFAGPPTGKPHVVNEKYTLVINSLLAPF